MLCDLCVCSEIPNLTTRHRWLFVQHPSERHKTTNTGHLAHRALAGSQLSWFRSRVEPPQPELEWGPPDDLVLLFPRSGAEMLDPEELVCRSRPASVVVLDGTWSQARKMARSIPQLDGVPAVALPQHARARFSLRQETFEGGMSTLDAVCWLVEAIEGPELADALLGLNRAFVERTLASRGTPLRNEARQRSDGGARS